MSGWSLRLARPEDAEHFPAIEKAAARLFETIPELAYLASGDVIAVERHSSLIRKGHA